MDLDSRTTVAGAASGSTDASWHIIDGASHALEEPNHASQFVSLVRNTLQSVSK